MNITESIISEIENVITNELPFNDEYQVTYMYKPEHTIFKFKKELLDFSIKIIIKTPSDKVHFIDVDVFINQFKIKSLIIHNDNQIRDLKNFLSFFIT